MDNLTLRIIELAIIIVITLFMRYGIPYIKEITEQTKMAGVVEWVTRAVDAAEQTITGYNSGAEKKAIVTKFLKEILQSKNISISDEQISTLIEAAVFAMNENKKGQY